MKYAIFTNYAGQRFLGEIISRSDDKEIVKLRDAVIVNESPIRDNQGNVRISLNFIPLMHTFDTGKEVTIKWTTWFEAAPQLISEYEKVLIKMSAAKANITLASSIPKGIPEIVKN